MPEVIYNVDDNNLNPMSVSPFDSELEFQNLLADHPQLLSGELVSPSRPRKWMLLKKEQSVPDGDIDRKWFSLDHLFIDQDAVPTLVEVKRSSDTRIRREVVGQMMDYAANAVEYWPIGRIREEFESEIEGEPNDFLSRQFGTEYDDEAYEEFWGKAASNLANKNIRLLFVADRIPRQLQRIVEFMNESMNPTEVLAIELKRFSSNGVSTIVPSIFGQTSAAELTKSVRSSARAPWTSERIAQWTAENDANGDREVKVLGALFDVALSTSTLHPTGSGVKPGFACRVTADGRTVTVWKVRSNGDNPQYWMVELDILKAINSLSHLREQWIEIAAESGIAPSAKNELIVELKDLKEPQVSAIKEITSQLLDQE